MGNERDITCRYNTSDSDLPRHVRLTNTLLARIIAQRSWFKECLLEYKKGPDKFDDSDVYKHHREYIHSLQTTFKASLSETNNKAAFLANTIHEFLFILNELLQRPELLINAKDYYSGCTALHMAVYCDGQEATHALLFHGQFLVKRWRARR